MSVLPAMAISVTMVCLVTAALVGMRVALVGKQLPHSLIETEDMAKVQVPAVEAREQPLPYAAAPVRDMEP